jgi:uncharacterized protein (DUF58 family)
MRRLHQIADWLETHWVTPAYSGWLMGGLAIFFFGAATNTMTGWLYAMSGIMVALLLLAAVLAERSLRGIQVSRSPVAPVSAGDRLTVELLLNNPTNQPKSLLQVADKLPTGLGQPTATVVDVIPAGDTYRWVYQHLAQQRGVYRWHSVQLRTAAPMGLFWCRRSQTAHAVAVVYPTVLPLAHCPLLDAIGQKTHRTLLSHRQADAATEGVTRTLRPYRWGDSMRLIHWRTSARYGELQVRELETYTGGQEFVIGLDSAIAWAPDLFEQAVVAAASLYRYARVHNLNVSLWTAASGLIRSDRRVLETLAATQPNEVLQGDRPFDLPLLWLSQHPNRLTSLPGGSRWLLWLPSLGTPHSTTQALLSSGCPGRIVQSQEPLQAQLQAPLESA